MDTAVAPVDAPVLDELALSLYLNGRHLMAVMTVPDRPAELAAGLLLVEQVIRTRDEIESIHEDGPCIRILTTDPFRVVVPRRGVITGCGGAASHLSERRLPPLPPSEPVDPGRVRATIARCAAPPPGLFTAVLDVGSGSICRSDDLGLSTAFARCVGITVRDGRPRAGGIAAVSHRVTGELVRAAVVSGVPVLSSTGLPTGLAVDLAARTGLCLCGDGGPNGFTCYAHPERLRL
jgi:FdhD protein